MAGQKDTIITRQVPTPYLGVPMDENGRPMSRQAVQISELIGLPKYSNVTMGPIMSEGWCEDTPEARKAKQRELMAEVAEIAGEYRNMILESLRDAGVDV